jgi:hypothetical protein
MLCWVNPKKSLANAVLQSTNFNRSNANQHLITRHDASEVPDLFSQDISNYSNSTSKKSGGNSLRQNKMTKYTDESLAKVSPTIGQSLLYKFFNDCNIAIHQANNKNLKQFIDYLLDNGNQLKTKRSECYFSRYKYKKMENQSFSYFIVAVKNIMSYCRGYYKEKFKVSETPFLMVSHDGWDSKDNDMLGVSIHVCVPVYWKVMNIAIGLKRVTSKKSKDTVEAIKVILKR